MTMPDPAPATLDIERLEELLAQRVSGPLVVTRHHLTADQNHGRGTADWSEVHVRTGTPDRMQSQFAHCCEDEDADLIEAAFNALPSLLSRLKAAEDALREVTRERDALKEAAQNLRAAQRAYMEDRGNDTLGRIVAVAARHMDAALASAGAEKTKEPDMTEDQIKHMVARFLTWRLPSDFAPDNGITFTPDFNVGTPYPMKHEPTGTNLLNAAQAEAMIRHLLEGLPATKKTP